MSAAGGISRTMPVEERPRISVGPFGFTIDAKKLQQWASTAKPGAQLMYAHGAALPSGTATVLLARELAEIGLVHLARKRVEGGWEFYAQRASNSRGANTVVADAKGAAATADDPATRRVLSRLARAANFAQVCPSNAQIAQDCDLNDGDAARYQIRKLITSRTIRVEHFGPNRPRVVTIIETGKRTKGDD